MESNKKRSMVMEEDVPEVMEVVTEEVMEEVMEEVTGATDQVVTGAQADLVVTTVGAAALNLTAMKVVHGITDQVNT